MKTRQFLIILALGLMVALVTLTLLSVSNPAQAYPGLSTSPTPEKSPMSRDFLLVAVKTERLRQARSEAGSLSLTSAGIVNGDFESGRVGWQEYSYQEWPLILHKDDLPVTPHVSVQDGELDAVLRCENRQNPAYYAYGRATTPI